MNEAAHSSQFSRNRMLLVGGIFVVVGLMVWWLVENRSPAPKPPPTREQWSEYYVEAFLSVLLVVVLDAVAIVIALRKRRQLPEAEKDWKGPDPHLDRMIPVQAYSPSPVMQRALRRTMSKQSS